MNIEIKTNVEVDEEIEFFPHFGLESVSGGTKISAKSPIFGAFLDSRFSRAALSLSDQWGAALGKVYRLNGDFFQFNTYGGLFIGEEDQDTTPNLVWLFHPKLKEGFEVVYPEPLSLNNLEDLFHSTCEELRDIYIEHLRLAKFSVSMKEKKKRRAPNA